MRYHAPFTLIKRKKVWYYRVYDECGERHTYTTARTNKLEAYQYCSDLQSQGLLGFSASGLPTGRMTFADFAADWWTPACRYVRESSLLGRRIGKTYMEQAARILWKRLVPKWGRCLLSAITPAAIEQWEMALVQREGLAPKTANFYKGILSTMLGQAVHEGLIKENPCKAARTMSARATERRGILTLEEVDRLFASPDVWDGDLVAMTANMTAACTGMRNREVAALKGGDIHEGFIHVEHSFNRIEGEKCTKTGDVRNLPVPRWLEERLRQLYMGDDRYLFTYDGRNPASTQTFVRNLHDACDRIGVDWKARNIVFHSWRHFLNSLLINKGIPEIVTQRMTGHTTDAMTEHYLHFDATQFAGVLDVTSAIVKDTR